MKHVPNVLTVSRGGVGVGIFCLYLIAFASPACRISILALYVAAAISDAIDGDLARRYKCESEFGKTADPVADKFLFWLSMWIFWYETHPYLTDEIRRIVIIFAVIVAAYDAVTTLLRVLKSRGIIKRMYTTRLAKGKTVYLMVGMGIFFGLEVLALWVESAPQALFPFFVFAYALVGAGLTLASAVAYLRLSLFAPAVPAAS